MSTEFRIKDVKIIPFPDSWSYKLLKIISIVFFWVLCVFCNEKGGRQEHTKHLSSVEEHIQGVAKASCRRDYRRYHKHFSKPRIFLSTTILHQALTYPKSLQYSKAQLSIGSFCIQVSRKRWTQGTEIGESLVRQTGKYTCTHAAENSARHRKRWKPESRHMTVSSLTACTHEN